MTSEVHASAPPPPRSSVFLSYASADRAAARALRDTLAAAGLEVWLDEEELAGGEAWDTKIRNQIRTCTYFMPIISATTEARREGYFRREWRFAVERTLDLADDVMFLLPVVIDGTRDTGARVPEKFFTVQWLRVPDGAATPELRQLADKIAHGDALAHSPTAQPAPVSRRERQDRKAADTPPPPFPPFPPYPEKGHAVRFLYNIVLWAGHMAHALWMRLPRAVRVVASIVIVFNLITWFFQKESPPASRQEKSATVTEIVQGLADSPAATPKNEAAEDIVKSLVNAAAHAFQGGRPLAIVTFGGSDQEATTHAANVFSETFKLVQQLGPDQYSVSPIPLEPTDDDDDALARGTSLDSKFLLTGFASRAGPGQPLQLTVKLYQVKLRTVVWTETFDATLSEAPATARRVLAAVRPLTMPTAAP